MTCSLIKLSNFAPDCQSLHFSKWFKYCMASPSRLHPECDKSICSCCQYISAMVGRFMHIWNDFIVYIEVYFLHTYFSEPVILLFRMPKSHETFGLFMYTSSLCAAFIIFTLYYIYTHTRLASLYSLNWISKLHIQKSSWLCTFPIMARKPCFNHWPYLCVFVIEQLVWKVQAYCEGISWCWCYKLLVIGKHQICT